MKRGGNLDWLNETPYFVGRIGKEQRHNPDWPTLLPSNLQIWAIDTICVLACQPAYFALVGASYHPKKPHAQQRPYRTCDCGCDHVEREPNVKAQPTAKSVAF
jgi:hypothetical protein